MKREKIFKNRNISKNCEVLNIYETIYMHSANAQQAQILTAASIVTALLC